MVVPNALAPEPRPGWTGGEHSCGIIWNAAMHAPQAERCCSTGIIYHQDLDVVSQDDGFRDSNHVAQGQSCCA